MNCKDTQQKTADQVLGLLSDIESRALQDHCAACTSCRALLDEHQGLMRRIREDTPAPRVSDELRTRLLQAGNTGARTHNTIHFRPSRIIAGLAAAAVLAFAVVAVQRFTTPFSAAEIWRIAHVRGLQSTAAHAPAVLGNTVFTLKDEGEISVMAAFDRTTGEQRWHSDAPSYGYMTAVNGTVYSVVPGSTGGVALAALDAATGKTRWRYDGDGAAALGIPNTAVVSDGAVYWSNGNSVCRLDAQTGAPAWSHAAATPRHAIRIAVREGLIFAACENTIKCLDAQSGMQQWETVLPGEIYGLSQPVLAASESGLYIANKLIDGSSFVASVSAHDGSVQWRKGIGTVYHLAVAGNVVVVRSASVMGLDGVSGERRWIYTAEGCSPVSISGDRVLFTSGGTNGTLVALNAENGRLVPMRFPIQACAGIVINGDMGFVQANDGILHALRINKV